MRSKFFFIMVLGTSSFLSVSAEKAPALEWEMTWLSPHQIWIGAKRDHEWILDATSGKLSRPPFQSFSSNPGEASQSRGVVFSPDGKRYLLTGEDFFEVGRIGEAPDLKIPFKRTELFTKAFWVSDATVVLMRTRLASGEKANCDLYDLETRAWKFRTPCFSEGLSTVGSVVGSGHRFLVSSGSEGVGSFDVLDIGSDLKVTKLKDPGLSFESMKNISVSLSADRRYLLVSTICDVNQTKPCRYSDDDRKHWKLFRLEIETGKRELISKSAESGSLPDATLERLAWIRGQKVCLARMTPRKASPMKNISQARCYPLK